MVKFPKPRPFGTLSEEEVLALLLEMEENVEYNTKSRYAADSEKYPGNVITFSQQHLGHLKKFPDVDPHQYIMNLKLMTKI